MIRGQQSQTEFARLFGVKQQVLSSWEHGKAQPNVECIIAMCMVGGVSSDWLLGLSDERSGGGVRVSGDGNAVASQSPGARVAASPAVATAVEVSRLLAIIESQQRIIARLAGVGKEV